MTLKLEERNYRGVPKGSALELKVSGAPGAAYTLNGRVDKGSTKQKSWTHAQLNNRHVKYPLDETGTVVVRIAAAFSGTSTSFASVEASIFKQNGSRHGASWSVSLSGKNGDVSRAKIRISVS